jgi:hypothetical protein
MSAGLIVAVAAMAGAVAAAIVVVLSSWIAARRDTSSETAGVDPRIEERFGLLHDVRVAERALNGAISAFTTTPRRLEKLADTAAEVAVSLRAAEDADFAPGLPREGDSFNVPYGLSRNATRTRPVIEWQGLDRALDAISAELGNQDPTFLGLAGVFAALENAARQVAQAIDVEHPDLSSTVAVCGFCGASGERRRRVIATHDALICERCVAKCDEILEDELGEEWRDS